jgi:hypothetical protein
VRGFHLPGERLQPAIAVEQLALFGGADQRLEFVLPVDVEQQADDLAQQLHRDLLAIQPGPRAPVAAEDAAHDELVARLVDGLLVETVAKAAGSGAKVERRHHFRALGIAADEVRPTATTRGERQGIHDDGLAGTGFAGQHGEPFAQVDVE